ncbi:hypothetical protein ABFU82_22630 [Nocardioides sp. WV_118_6]
MAAIAWAKIVHPRVKHRAATRAAANEVLLGRPAVPANRITGAPAEPAKPAIGQLFADLAAVVDEIVIMLNEVHHELHPNNGSSMKDALTRTEADVRAARTELGKVVERLAAGDERFDDQAARLGRIEGVLADDLRVVADTAANATDTSRVAVRTIGAALMTEPPADFDPLADPPADIT